MAPGWYWRRRGRWTWCRAMSARLRRLGAPRLNGIPAERRPWRHTQAARPPAGESACELRPTPNPHREFCRQEIRSHTARWRFPGPMDATTLAERLADE